MPSSSALPSIARCIVVSCASLISSAAKPMATRPRTSATRAAAPAATVIGTRKRRQCSQAAAAAIAGGDREDDHRRLRAVEIALADRGDDRGAGRLEDAADEGEQEDDAGQRHAPLPGEEFGKAPGGGGDEQADERGGPVAVDIGRHIIADHADRGEQDRRGDADEDVVEAGQQPEMLLVDRGHVAPRRDEIA